MQHWLCNDLIFRSNNPTHKYFLAVDPVSGALFISDTNSRRIYKVRSLTGGRLLADNAEVVAGTGEQCLPFDERCGDGGKAVEATLMSPKGKVETLKKTKTKARSYCLLHGLSPSHQMKSHLLMSSHMSVWGEEMFLQAVFTSASFVAVTPNMDKKSLILQLLPQSQRTFNLKLLINFWMCYGECESPASIIGVSWYSLSLCLSLKDNVT